MALAPDNNMDSMVGRLVVEKGLATREEVMAALKRRKEASEASAAALESPSADSDGAGGSLADLLVEEGVVTRHQVERLKPELDEQRSTQQIPGYRILSRLGAGAMATVYKARQVSLDRMVAVKVLPRKFLNNPQFVERFYAEGKAAAKLNHSNIVQAIDVGQSGEFHYFVMEYVEGRTVFDDLDQKGRYSEVDALRIGIDVARALEHAHAAGFIHRDVKPKNIMLTQEGATKLADMGLARAVSDREAAEAEAGKAYGTPYYISPEQIRGKVDVDFRADIYGLGATLYHMVTGKVPFDGPSPSAVMHKHLKTPLKPPDHVVPELSTGMSEIIEVAMAKDRKSRYATTGDLLQDLEAVARGEAPMQARQRFDLSSLTGLEPPEGSVEKEGSQTKGSKPAPPMWEQPLFWAAAAGWGVAMVVGLSWAFSG